MNTRTLPKRDAAIADKQNLIGMIAVVLGFTTAMFGVLGSGHWWATITGTYVVLVGETIWNYARITYRGAPATHRVIPASAPAAFIALGVTSAAFVATLICQVNDFDPGTEISITIMFLALVTGIYAVIFAPTGEEIQQTRTSAEVTPTDPTATR